MVKKGLLYYCAAGSSHNKQVWAWAWWQMSYEILLQWTFPRGDFSLANIVLQRRKLSLRWVIIHWWIMSWGIIRRDKIHRRILSEETHCWETAYTRTPVFDLKDLHKMSRTELDAVRPAWTTKKMSSMDLFKAFTPNTAGKQVSVSFGRLQNEWLEVYLFPDQHSTTVTQVVVNKAFCRPYRNVSRLAKWLG
jgi:hypothetical protein